MRPLPALALAAAALLLFGAVGCAVVWQGERLRAKDRRAAAAHVGAGAAFALEQQVSRSLSATYALAAIIRQHGRIEAFEGLAAEMLPMYGGLSSLQLAPGGVVGAVHPLRGNERVLGHDLLRDPDRRFHARAAIESRQLTVAGPFDLLQGGTGLIGRLAVFVPDEAALGGERFWGLVSAVIRMPDLLDAARMGWIGEAGYAWELRRHDGEAHAAARFAGEGRVGADPVEFTVSIPNGRWTLTLAPRRGWGSTPGLPLLYGLALLGALALATLVHAAARRPALLRRMVEERTAELARTTAQLAADAAERRAVEEQLRQAQRMDAIGQLAAGVAHDFNNLLTGIVGHASVLLETTPPGSEEHEAAATIRGAGLRAAELTRQLLGFARRAEIAETPVDAHAVVREVSTLLSRTLDKRIRIVERLRAPCGRVIGDAGRLQQALLNLAVNARDAMPDGGELALESERVVLDPRWCERHPGTSPGPHLALTVADTGAGIPPELLGRIFDPFFTTKEPGRGTGMGLALVYGVTRDHRGAIEVRSAPGEGSRFTLYLPAPAGAQASPPAAAPSPIAPGEGLVLVIDDDEVPRAAAAQMLRRLGCEVVAFARGEDAVRWYRERGSGVRAALLDLSMPGMDGAACLRALLALDPDLPVLLTSGAARDDEVRRLVSAGASGLLRKPFGLPELAAALPQRRRPWRVAS